MPRHPSSSSSAGELSDRVYSALIDEARQRPAPVHLLNVGDTYLDPMPVAAAQAQRTADHRRLHNYAPVNGEPALIDAIVPGARRHGVHSNPSTPGDGGGDGRIHGRRQSILEPGDEVILLAPFWPSSVASCDRGARAGGAFVLRSTRRPELRRGGAIEAPSATRPSPSTSTRRPTRPAGWFPVEPFLRSLGSWSSRTLALDRRSLRGALVHARGAAGDLGAPRAA